jgi:hypothetical protein
MFGFIDKSVLPFHESVGLDISHLQVIFTTNTDDFFTDLSKIGLQIEKELLEKHILWNYKKIPNILIIRGRYHETRLNPVIQANTYFKADEILLHRDPGSVIRIVLGHPRAIIKYCASLHKIKDVENIRSIQGTHNEFTKALWWADRMKLKVHIV